MIHFDPLAAISNRPSIFSSKVIMDELKLVRVTVVETESEAVFVRAALEDIGIKPMVSGLELGAFGDAVDGGGEIEIHVNEADFEKAKILVDEILNDESDPIPAWTCKCGEDVDEGFFVCWSCGEEYKPTESS